MKTKHNDQSNSKPINVITERMYTDVVTGATIELSIADARLLYELTDVTELIELDEDSNYIPNVEACDKLMTLKTIIRAMAKTILFRAGNTTSAEDMITMFKTNTIAPLVPTEIMYGTPGPRIVGKIDLPVS